jgi:hypothetical protein
MAFVHVQGNGHQATSGTTNATTLGAAPTVGNVVCVGLTFFAAAGGGTTTVSDGTNTYTITPNSPSTFDASSGQSYLFYWIATGTPGATITATFTNTIVFSDIWVDEFSASGTISFDTDGKGTGSGTAINTPSLTPAQSGELFFGVSTSAVGISSANSPFVLAAFGIGPDGPAGEYALNVSSAQAMNFTQSSGTYSSMMMAFKYAETSNKIAWIKA